MKPPIEFWFDFISPFGYFASLRIDGLAAAYGRQTDWTSMLLGVSVNKVMGIPPVIDLPLKGEYLVRDAQRYARQHGVPYRRSSPHPTSSPLLAGRCFAWARTSHPREARALAAALFRRYFVDIEDIGAEAVVSAALQDAGLDPLEWQDALRGGAPAKLLRGNVERAIARGVFGSPFFFADGEPFFGVEKLPVLDAWLQSGGW